MTDPDRNANGEIKLRERIKCSLEDSAMLVTVFGATGATGRELIRSLGMAGHRSRGQARDVARLPSGCEPCSAQVDRPDEVRSCLAGSDAVICAIGLNRRSRNPWSAVTSPKTIISQATGHIIDALEREGPRRLICMSAYGVGDLQALPWLARQLIRFSNIRHSYDDLIRVEALVRASHCDWTIVRPTVLTNAPLEGPTVVCRRVIRSWATIPRRSVATYLSRIIDDPSTFRQTITITRTGGLA